MPTINCPKLLGHNNMELYAMTHKRDAARAWPWIIAICGLILLTKILPVILFPGPTHP